MIPTAPIPFWQYFDLLSLSVLVVVISILLVIQHKKTGGLSTTISRAVASSPRSSLVFSIVMTIFFPLYYAFLWFWVGPSLQMPSSFYILVAISALCEMVFVWAPARGKASKVHAVAAGIVGILMFILPIVILLCGNGIGTIGKIGIFSYLIVAMTLFGIMISSKFSRYTFQLEVAYCVAFLTMMSLIAHS